MIRPKHWRWIWAIAVVYCIVASAPAMSREYLARLCIEDIIKQKIEFIEFPHVRFPVGCEIIDCCPGCPGPGPLDWRIIVSGDPITTGVVFQFENLPLGEAGKLRIEGKGKWLTDKQLQINRGKTTIRGFAVNPKIRPPVVVPRLAVNMDRAVKLSESADKNAREIKRRDAAVVKVSIEQLLGKTIVNKYIIDYIFRWCDGIVQVKSDRIDLDNNAGDDSAVILLDGRRSSGCVNDEVWRTNNIVAINNVLSKGSCNCETVVFSDDDAMQLVENVSIWTDSTGDLQKIDLTPDLLQLPVTIWILQGTFATTQARVVSDMARANQLYNTMNCGVGFQTVAINDATANPNTAGLIDATCTQAANLRTQIGFTNNNLNVYYVRNPGGARGWWCGNNTILIGSGADNESLAHEFGHALSLGHTNTVAGMSGTNLMVTGGTGRNNITEGQCFRCNVNTNSSLNALGIRTGSTRSCPDGTTGPKCPSLSLDVVPD